jgi:4-amino-4-deoxy-L-arabinose transferase-like glycosyltransferase
MALEKVMLIEQKAHGSFFFSGWFSYLPLIFLLFLSLCYSFAPQNWLVHTAEQISPIHSIQPKTILLLSYLKVILPVFSVLNLFLLFTTRKYLIKLSIKFQTILNSPWWLPGILILAATLRLAWIIYFPTHTYAESSTYFKNATELSQGYGYVYDIQTGRPMAAWPVGYPVFLAMLFFISSPSLLVAKLANVALSILTIWLAYEWIRRIFNRQVATFASLILAILPGLVVYSSLVQTDLLFLCMTTASLLLVIVERQSSHAIAGSFFTGLMSGMTALVRSTGITLLPIWIFFHWLVTRKINLSLKWTIGLFLGTFLIITPWIVRNYSAFGKIILGSTNGGVNFWMGNNPQAYGGFMWPRDESNPLLPLVDTETIIDQKGYELGSQFIREHPWQALALLPKKAFYLYNSNDFGLLWNSRSADNPTKKGTGIRAYALTNLVYILVSIYVLFGIASLFWKKAPIIQYFGILFALYWTMVHLIYFGEDRFSLPLFPILSMYAAIGISWVLNFHFQNAKQQSEP